MIDFSVLISVYNKEHPVFLEQALDSLDKQKTKPAQIVIVKDGLLTSGLDAVLESFKTKLPLEIHLYKGDGKLGGALNFGLGFCKHDVVARMDSDDLCSPDRFDRQIRYFVEHDLDILGSYTEEFIHKKGDLSRIRKVPVEVSLQNSSLRSPMNHPTVVFNKTKIQSIGSYLPLEGFEDWYLWLRALAAGLKLENLPEILVYARLGDGFAGRRSGLNYFYCEFQAIKRFYSEGLIGTFPFCTALVSRLPFRVLPPGLLKLIYRIIRHRG